MSIQAGLFSAVSSAFVIDIQSKLEPDPNEQSAALLRAILFTLNQSALPAETVTLPPIHEDPPSKIVTASSLMYASLLISLLAAFVAMLGKQWLNRYLRNAGGSMADRCGDRQRKCEGLEKWPLHRFVESLPVMLQISLLLLALGLCQHMLSVETLVAYTLMMLTALGILFYLGIVVAGASSYECPFQTPVSVALREMWKATRHQRSIVIFYSRLILFRTNRALKRWNRHHFPRPSLPLALEAVESDPPVGRDVELPWVPKDPALSCTDADDIRCVSWILRNITDREAIDAAIRLAGIIRWFEDGIDAKPPYDVIVSTFKSCFDPTDKVYPGSMDRAYHSARAILQIHIFALCVSPEFARRFPLSHIGDNAVELDGDNIAVFRLYRNMYSGLTSVRRVLSPKHSPAHLRWASNLLLRLDWAEHRARGSLCLGIAIWSESRTWDDLPPAVALDRLLVWCMLLGGRVDKNLLMIEDRSCVVLYPFPPKMHISSFLVFTWTRFYLN